jgi:glycosyltransferase involved in cell wall biosynthesis
MGNIKVLWTHNFNPDIKNSGNFMHQFAAFMNDFGVDIQLFYTGPLYSIKNVHSIQDKITILSPKFDIVHAQFGSGCSLATAGAKAKKIVSLRGSDWYKYKSNTAWGSLHSFLATLMTRLAIRHYDTVVTMSKRMSKEVEKKFPGAVVHTIPDPIDLNEFRPVDKSYARKKLFGINNSGLWVLFTTMSISNPVKRVWLAKKAVKAVSKNFKNVELKVASGISHKLMPLFVSSCDIALLTSIHEGWPNSVKEALACNVPFVATDVSDLSEIANIEPSCRISEADPEVIAENLCKALKQNHDFNLKSHVESMRMEIACQRLSLVYRKTLDKG